MKIFGREPALWLNSLSAILGLVVTFNVGLTEVQAGWLVAGVSAVLGAIAAALTRPIAVQAFTTLVATIGSGVAAFGYEVAPTTTAAINGALLAIIMFITRGQVTPSSPTAPARATQ
ncbi:hypothetical protein DMH25_08040 [Streptomyces sp. WAC 01325]|uniref:hypothetical protein n=1 Tax=Streptomyces sp. WAC 01325 TaxID=2203202 RepID=UPI000F86E6EB|nr:hypothetical protein [Streptomyces sp. WAC 01325]RSN13732.1 hypothetical protein DMH25_08040 [Streptomyces sp. WAC 01325]